MEAGVFLPVILSELIDKRSLQIAGMVF